MAVMAKTRRSTGRSGVKGPAARRFPQLDARPRKTEAYVRTLLERYRNVDFHKLTPVERGEMVDAFCGSLSWAGYGADEFIVERRAEAQRENRE